MKKSIKIFIAALASVTSLSVNAACDVTLNNPAFVACYDYTRGFSALVISKPKMEDLVGTERKNNNYGTDNPYEDNSRYQSRSLVAGAFEERYRNYQAEDFRQEYSLSRDRQIKTDVLRGTPYKRMLIVGRDMTAMQHQSELFTMANVLPARDNTIEKMKLIDEYIARDVKSAGNDGQVIVYTGAAVYRDSERFYSRDVNGVESYMMAPALYFKFWYVAQKDGSTPTSVGAFMFPDDEDLQQLEVYRVNIDRIEEYTGANFNLVGYEDSYKSKQIKSASTRKNKAIRQGEQSRFKTCFGSAANEDGSCR